MVKDLGLEDRVSLVGDLGGPALAACYDVADVFVPDRPDDQIGRGYVTWVEKSCRSCSVAMHSPVSESLAVRDNYIGDCMMSVLPGPQPSPG